MFFIYKLISLSDFFKNSKFDPAIYPQENKSSKLIFEWMLEHLISKSAFIHLQQIFNNPDFNKEDVCGYSTMMKNANKNAPNVVRIRNTCI